ANIGIATGKRSGIFVVDIDGEKGEESLIDLLTSFGALPETYEVETAKGRHFYFIQPTGLHSKNSVSDMGAHIDVRGDGGYVVAPPSVHPETGKAYSVKHNRELAQAPAWLLEFIDAARRRERGVEQTIPDKIPQHKRDITLTRIAGYFRYRG